VHFEAIALDLVTSENRQQLVALQQFFHGLLSEVVRTLTLWVVLEVMIGSALIVHWVGPKKVTEDTVERNLLEAINSVNLLQL